MLTASTTTIAVGFYMNSSNRTFGYECNIRTPGSARWSPA
jgi:hypothetical protein